MPKRIQRRRMKGWRMPEGAVCVTRPGRWGNPFKVGTWWRLGEPGRTLMSRLQAFAPNEPGFTLIENPEQSVEWFRRYAELWPKDLSDLRGKDLACWCGLDRPCHADVLLEIANR